MAHWGVRTEHAGAKNGGGYYGRRAEAKADSRVKRRANDLHAVTEFEDDLAEQWSPVDPEWQMVLDEAAEAGLRPAIDRAID